MRTMDESEKREVEKHQKRIVHLFLIGLPLSAIGLILYQFINQGWITDLIFYNPLTFFLTVVVMAFGLAVATTYSVERKEKLMEGKN